MISFFSLLVTLSEIMILFQIGLVVLVILAFALYTGGRRNVN
jgi:hypothetical protein